MRYGSEFLSKGCNFQLSGLWIEVLLKKLSEKSKYVKCLVPENLSQCSQDSGCAKLLKKECTLLHVKYRKHIRFKKQNIFPVDDLMLCTISYLFLYNQNRCVLLWKFQLSKMLALNIDSTAAAIEMFSY